MKKAVVHLHNGILFGHKTEGNLTFCESIDGPWRDLEGITLSEISKAG